VRLGARIRSFRRARGLTLVELARLADLSHPFLSQLERGQARPSMTSLERIARALGSSQIELIAASADMPVAAGGAGADGGSGSGSGSGRVSVVRRAEGPQGPFGGGEARILVHGQAPFVPMEFRGSNGRPGEFYTHEEDEFLHVVGGRVLVDLADEGEFELMTGDSIHYAGGTLHRWWSADGGEYRLFIVKQRGAGS
jgi:quercetin dioxygenase-like cupin family protein/DNA-binding XRE family transcriptional regulator